MIIKGAKAGMGGAKQPSIAKDTAASISYAKILYGLSEGEIYGLVNGAKSIFLDDTPLLDDNGNPNFKDDKGNLAVTWDFRVGTNDQDYIKGFPAVENETAVSVEIKSSNPFVKTITNSQLSAVRLRLSWAALREQDKKGNIKGITIAYAVDVATDGGAYQTVLNTKVSDKTSGKYERSHRIDLPRGNSWNIRVRRITPNATSELISDKMYIDAITEVIDAKLRYPNTAMLGVQYDASTFSNIAKLSARCRGKLIAIPTNYNPETRTYNGIWNGTFKIAYSNNPAWVFYDICTQWRYGLGDRLDKSMIDKWSLYRLAQYCDQPVPDGMGGYEPRFAVNVYLQSQQDAFSVLQSLAAIFRAMTYWQGEQIILDADLPKDPVYTFSRANVVDGAFSYTGTRARDRHTIAKVAWDNPAQRFKTEYEWVRDEKAIAKYGIKVLDINLMGCTSQGQAQRAGLWALKSEQLETRTVTFKTGLDGFIPTVGSIINVSDEVLAGRANGGRVSAISKDNKTITLDRDTTVNIGDTLIINGDDGKAQRRIVSMRNGRDISVSAAFSGVSAQNVWVVDSDDLKTMQFRVLSIVQDDNTFTITALQYEIGKYDSIDNGIKVESTPSVYINPQGNIDAPASVTIGQRNRVEQGQTIATMTINWSQVSGAVAYDVEYQKDGGNWVSLPRTGNNSVDVDGVYSGVYIARVKAVSATNTISSPATSEPTVIKGKTGTIAGVLGLVATGILFGMRLDWSFPDEAGDTAYTEIQVASQPDTNVSLLGQYAYPTNTATIQGLEGYLEQWYRARLVDKLGNIGEWTDWVRGVTDGSAEKVLKLLNGQITQSQLYKDLGAKIDKIEVNSQAISNEVQNRIDAVNKEATARIAAFNEQTNGFNTSMAKEIDERKAAISSLQDGLTKEQSERKTADADIISDVTSYKTKTDNKIAAAQESINIVTTAQLATATKVDGVYAQLNPDMAGSDKLAGDGGFAGVWSETTARIEGDSALGVRIDNVTANFANNLAFVKNTTQATADALASLASQVTTIQAAQGGNLSLVMDNYYTKVQSDLAISSGLTAFKTQYLVPELDKLAQSFSLTETTAKIEEVNNKLNIATSKIDGVFAQLAPPVMAGDSGNAGDDTQNAGVWTETSARIEGDASLADRIDRLNSKVDDNAANIISEQKTRADSNSALAEKMDGVYAQVNPQMAGDNGNAGNEKIMAGVWSETTARAEEDAALARRIDNLSVSLKDDIAFIKTTQQVTIDNLASQASRSDSLQATFDNANQQLGKNTAAIQEEAQARADGDNAIAQRVSTLQTTSSELVAATKDQAAYIKQNTASIQTQQYSINGLYAQYTVKVDVNGRVTGFGLASNSNDSAFSVRADRFWIAPPDGAEKGEAPFIVVATPQNINGTVIPAGTYIKSAYIQNASIDTLKIRGQAVSVTTALTKNINGTLLESGGTAYTDTLYLDTNGAMTKVEFTMMGFNSGGSSGFSIECIVNGVSQAGYNVKGSFGFTPSVANPFLVPTPTGQTQIYIKITSNGSSIAASSYFLTATALKR